MQKKLIAKTAAAFALAGGLTLASQAGASAAGTVSVTPATGLTSGATVTVSATGLTPNLEHFVGLCGTVGGQYGCDATGVVSVTSNASGAASTPLTVKKTFTGTVGGGGTVTVDCGVVQCVIGVYNADATAGGSTTVSFS